MKKVLIIGLTIVALSLLTVFAIPVFAHGPAEGDSEIPEQETWQTMHEACEEGDWEAMAEAAEGFHEETGYGDCHGYGTGDGGPASGWGGMTGSNTAGWDGMIGW